MKEVATFYDNFEFHKAVSAINRWINNDLSAFYLEAMKDRLYCGDGGGVIEEIFRGLLRMLTPITPLLVEEAWEHRPEWMKQEKLVHPFHQTLDDPISRRNLKAPKEIQDDIPWLMNANTAIKTAQEVARKEKLLGSSLESSVVLYLPPGATRDLFKRYASELDSIFVVSSVRFGGTVNYETPAPWKFRRRFAAQGGQGSAWVMPPGGEKCPRCWRYVSLTAEELCERCEDVVKGDKGEGL
jgi:isoleucyl-tRNA synthetase